MAATAAADDAGRREQADDVRGPAVDRAAVFEPPGVHSVPQDIIDAAHARITDATWL